MPFPTTVEELKNAGYVFDGSGFCRGCKAKMDWYSTPKGKRMPFDAGTAIAHWSTCPARDQFKKK